MYSSLKNVIDQFLVKLMREYNVSVVGYAVLDRYKIIATNTLSIHDDIPVTEDSLFQACSLSKVVTALGILVLQNQKKIDIDKSVNTQLTTWEIPEHKYAGKVSIRHCLSMTSGLYYQELNPVFLPYTQDMPVPSLKNILNGTSPATNYPVSLGFQPGIDYHYSGAGYMTLQQVIEDMASQTFIKFINENVLKPLAMNHSFFQQPLSTEWTKKAVPGFKADNEMLKDGWDNIPTLASGGLWSTPLDLANLMLGISKAYVGEDCSIIPQKLAAEMLMRQTNSAFGLGVVIDGEEKAMNFRKNGNNRGYHNQLIMFPNTGQGIVIMSNSANGMGLIQSFIAFVASHFKWPCYSLHFDELKILHCPRCRL